MILESGLLIWGQPCIEDFLSKKTWGGGTKRIAEFRLF